MSNIIDFNAFRRQGEGKDRQDEQNQEINLPDIPMAHEANAVFGETMFRMVLLGQMTAEAVEAIKKAGMDPANFHLNDDSVARFLTTDTLGEDVPYNGVCFDWNDADAQVRVALTVNLDFADFEAPPQARPSVVDILRLLPDADHWQVLENGEWTEQGPPDAFFDNLEEIWDNWLDDDEDDEDWDDDDDDDDWIEDRTIAQLDISVDLFNKLTAAGIETIDYLIDLKPRLVAALVGQQGFEEIKAALDDEDLEIFEDEDGPFE